MKTAVIIAAGGLGQRFGDSAGKQLFEYKGKPVLIRTIEKFIGQADQLIVVIKKEDINRLSKYLKQFNLQVDNIVPGGAERYDSVRNGLNLLRKDIDYVLIHDGVRANISVELIAKIKEALKKHPAVIPVIPVSDTIKVIREDHVVNTPERAGLFRVQTPQGFAKELLSKAYNSVDLKDCTDDSMVVERYGAPIFTVEGEHRNIKITIREDLSCLE